MREMDGAGAMTTADRAWPAAAPPAAVLSPDEGQRLLDELGRSLTKRMALANGTGALAVWAIALLSFPALDPGSASKTTTVVSVVLTGVYILATVLIGPRVGRWLFEPIGAPLREGRALTPVEKSLILTQPARQVAWAFLYWLVAAALFAILNLTLIGTGLRDAERTLETIILGGLTSSAVAYLLVEQRLRPVFAIALAGELPGRTMVLGIRPRLLLAWALGSGIPLAGAVAFAAGGVDLDRGRLVALVILLGCVGLAAGGTTILVAARSVGDPLARLGAAMARVQRGDFDAQVSVDDGGEVGFLEAGFNAMVAGLRERELVRDVFGRHVGAEVARRALESSDLGGEQRDVSVLFVDVVASTRLAEQRPPAEVVTMLNALFDVVVRVVSAAGGWVNKFEGDAALCVFGAPDDEPDHAARACRAARELRGELAALEATMGFDAGIGVSSGTVVAGNVGAAQRYEYTVIGDPVNEASRLTDAAKENPARLLAAEAAIAAAGDEAAAWVEVGVIPLRGRETPTRVFAPRSTTTHVAATSRRRTPVTARRA